MTSHSESLVNFYDSRKRNTIFVDNIIIISEGFVDILIKGRQRNQTFIIGVLYLPRMKSNLLSNGHLLKKRFTVHLDNNHIKVFYAHQKAILRALFSQN